MYRMIRSLVVFFLSLVFFATARSGDWFDPNKGDLVLWAGDSITHQCGYTQYLENFLYTRFYDKQLRFANAGIKGDAARDLLDRFQEDVSWRTPQWATLLLGMNDGRYMAFDEDNFAIYRNGVTEAVDQFTALRTRIALMSPTMFDYEQYARRLGDPDFRFTRLNAYSGYNDKLLRYGDWLEGLASERDLAYIDVGRTMLSETRRRRQSDPEFTFSPDSIHPDPSGMAWIAVDMARAFAGSRNRVNSTSIDLKQDGRVTSDGIARLDRIGLDELTATITPRFLPWVLPATGSVGPEPWLYLDDPTEGFAKALKRMPINEDRLIVSGLEEGRYHVRIDGRIVLTASERELEQGVNLEARMNTSGYRQSLRLAELNALRNDRAIRPYRDLQARLKGVRRREGSDSKAFREAQMEIDDKGRPLLELARELESEIHRLAIPKPYKLEIEHLE